MESRIGSGLFSHQTPRRNDQELPQLLLNNPDQFISKLTQLPDWGSLEMASLLDDIDPFSHTNKQFNIRDRIPFAGHSLGPVFKPVIDQIVNTVAIQENLHDGHFPTAHPDGKQSGHWFDCDKQKSSLAAVQKLLGCGEDEFTFSANGLSDNLAKLMDTFYRPLRDDWFNNGGKIIILANEFYSDQAVVVSVIQRKIQSAIDNGIFTEQNAPKPEAMIIKIKPNNDGIYPTDEIIRVIRENAANTKLISLSDIVFSTGQRLELAKIFAATKNDIEKYGIIVGLDLAHSVGNRKINLNELPVTFAVGCAYKHLSGFAGSGFGYYVSRKADLKKYPPLQGWKAAESSKVFATIHEYQDGIMKKQGADAFRISNPPPVSLHPAQVFLSYFDSIGFDKCFNKSESMTRYMLALLKLRLGNQIRFITPEDPNQRGAMIVLQVYDVSNVSVIEEYLKNERTNLGSYEIDVRPPNNIRLTAHYGYTSFVDINRMISKLELAIKHVLDHQQTANMALK